ncbi:hypothetical protein JCM19000A_27520 [Silvimonas sp. JCM 19000]
MTSEAESTVKASLEKFFGGLTAGTKVSSSQIGALAEKLPQNGNPDLYKAYSDCLKVQMAIALQRRGVQVASPDMQALEAAADDRVENGLSRVTPSTPSAKLVELLGEPISDDVVEGTGLRYVRYQYKDMYFAAEFFKGRKRLAIVLAANPSLGVELSQTLLSVNGAPLATVGAVSEEASLEISGRAGMPMRTELFGGSEMDYRVFRALFYDPFAVLGENDDCKNALNAPEKFHLKDCPKMAVAKPVAVLLAYTQGGGKAASDAFFNLLSDGPVWEW